MKKHFFKLGRYCLFIIFIFTSSNSFCQKLITGVIMDGSIKETLIGGTVKVKGTKIATVTDVNGKFSIMASPTDVLEFTYVGLEKQEVVVGEKEVIDVTMLTNAHQLTEVVAIGYGSVKKNDLTGSVSVISAKELTKNPSASAAQAIQGKTPGVLVSQNGTPGGGATIRVRGVGSISKSADPIYIIDGVQATDINGIQPQDIESMQVLKDASAAAIYGANGSNGVIIITTKRGKSGKPQVNFNSNFGVSLAPKQYDVMNADQYSAFYTAMDKATYDNLAVKPTPTYVPNPAYGQKFRQDYYGAGWQQGTNWQNLMSRNGLNQSYNVSVAGGGDNSNFNVSMGYSNEQGNVVKNSFERYQIRANSDFKLSKYVKVGENLRSSYGIGQDPRSMSEVFNFGASPLMKVYNSALVGGYESYQVPYWYDANGNLTQIEANGVGAPILNTANQDKSNRIVAALLGSNMNYNVGTSASVYAQVDFTEWLMYKVTPSADVSYRRTKMWIPYYQGNRTTGSASLTETYEENIALNLENQLLFKKCFNEIHNFQATAVCQIRSTQKNNISGQESGFPVEQLNTLSNGTTINGLSGTSTDYKMLSYLGRIIYDYKGKYYATASLRSDGVSLFAPGEYRRGNFSSGSVAWKINEDFFKDVQEIDLMKLRLGWGQTGNSNIGDPFQYYSRITTPNNFYSIFGGNQTRQSAQYVFDQFGSKEIHWESAEMINYGLDLNLFKNRLQISAEYYVKKNNDLLVQVPISGAFGINQNGSKPWYNAGKIQNSGVEISAQWRDNIGDFGYGIISNLTTINNKVLSLPVTDITTDYNRTVVGSPIGSLYGYVADGIVQLNEENYTKVNGQFQKDLQGRYIGYKFASINQSMPTQPGDIKYKDLNGDGVISPTDKTIIGNTIPTFTYTLGFDFTYKNFDCNVFFFGVGDFNIYNKQRASLSSMNDQDLGNNKLVDYAQNHWTLENASTTYVRVDPNNINKNDQISTFWIENGSFLRIKDLQIGYKFTPVVCKALGISSFRIYANASNLYCFTAYKGIDPEAYMSGTPSSSGVDGGGYTVPRSYSCGLQIGF